MRTPNFITLLALSSALQACGRLSHDAAPEPSLTPAATPANTPPLDSSGWVWSECGTIPGAEETDADHLSGTIGADLRVTPYPDGPPGNGVPVYFRGLTRTVVGLSVSRSGTELVADGGLTVGWKLEHDFVASGPIWRTGYDASAKVDISPTGDFVARSGDARVLNDALTGKRLGYVPVAPPSTPNWGNLLRFSADGALVGGGGYDNTVEVFSVPDLAPVFGALSAVACPGVAFSKDGKLLVTSGPELFRMSDGQRVWPVEAAGSQSGGRAKFNWVELTADETRALVSNCDRDEAVAVCRTTVHDMADGQLLETLPAELGLQPDISREGDWVVAGGYLYHLPTGALRLLDARAGVARFTPESDIIAGRDDGSLVKYCLARTQP